MDNKRDFDKFYSRLTDVNTVLHQSSITILNAKHESKGYIYIELFPDYSFRIFTVDMTP